MRLPSKSSLPSPVPSECSPSRAHPTPNTCSRIWPVPLLHFPLMLCAPSKLGSNSRERHLLQSSHHKRFRQYALVDVSVGISVGRKMGAPTLSTPADITPKVRQSFRGLRLFRVIQQAESLVGIEESCAESLQFINGASAVLRV